MSAPVWYPITSGVPPPAPQAGLNVCAQPAMPCSCSLTNPSISPPSMSAIGGGGGVGSAEAAVLPVVVTVGRSLHARDPGTHGTVPGFPASPGIPSAPGYVPKYVSNERFSCMMITTWRIL